ncbi:MAG: hypothetical protein L0Z50_23560, partial [Verrucomicrobiales bacterium]|nr:hypothetical protein [Verrucomicrobiales bacterium]
PLAGQVCFRRNPDGSSASDDIDICLSYGSAAFTGSTGTAGPANGAQLAILNSKALRRTAHFDASSFGSTGQLNADFALGPPTPAGTQSGGAAADLAQNVTGQISLPGADPLVRQGENLFLRETFLGNGRTCGTCHVPAERFSLPPSRIAELADSDPLFINEQNVNQLVLSSAGSVNPSAASGSTQPSDLEIGSIITGSLGGSATVLSGSGNTYRVIGGTSLNIAGNVVSDQKGNGGTLISFASGNLNGPTPSNTDVNGLEKSSLLRGARALVLENINGFTQNGFMRGSPSLMNVKFTAPYGLSGDFADLQSFAANAVRQHFTRSLNRVQDVDFRVPTSEELDAMATFQNSLTLPANENFDEANRFERFLTNDAQRRGRDNFFGISKCSVCHGGKTLSHSDGRFGTTGGVNESFNTGVAQQSINTIQGLPTEQGVSQAANTRRFNVPGLVGAQRTAPFFHANSSPDLTSAIVFYDTADFIGSPAATQVGGGFAGGLSLGNIADMVAFLQAVGEEPFGAPTILGTRSGNTVSDNASIEPFESVTIDDPDSPAQTLIVTISMDDAAKGRFSNLNGFGLIGAGQATFVGTDTEATVAVRGLKFQPTEGRLPLNASETVRFTISINDNIVTPTINDRTEVTVRSVELLHPSPSTTDAWDVGTGAIVTGSSGFEALSDARDMLGGVFATGEPGTAIFADGKPPGFIHAIEWQTPSPISLQVVRLFAQGDESNAREFASFVLKTKSSPTSGFDIQLLSYIPSHPYTFEDAVTSALFSENLTPTTGQFFRAEFEQFGSLAPRIIELDGFESVPCAPAPSGIVAFWPGDMHADDLSSGLNGTEVGTLFYDDGKVSSGFGFDGAGEINVPHDNKLNLQTFTLEAWVFPTSLDGGNEMIICKEDTSGVQYELSLKGPIVNFPNNIPIGNLAVEFRDCRMITEAGSTGEGRFPYSSGAMWCSPSMAQQRKRTLTAFRRGLLAVLVVRLPAPSGP